MLLIGITLLVDPYLVARTIILSILVVTGIKFIDNNTIVRLIVLPKGNKSVTLYGNNNIKNTIASSKD